MTSDTPIEDSPQYTEAVGQIASALGRDAALLDEGAPQVPEGVEDPQAIWEILGEALLKGAEQILLAFVSGMVLSAAKDLTAMGGVLAKRVTEKLTSLIQRADRGADREELKESMNRLEMDPGRREEAASDAEAALAAALEERGLRSDRAREVAVQVRTSAMELLDAG